MDATLVMTNAKVVTVDEQFSVAQAVAVRGDTIVAVGSAAVVAALVGPSTQVIDLGGRTLLPGANDGHGHAAMFGGTRPPLAMDLYAPRIGSAADVASEVRLWAAKTPKGAWIRGYGWDPVLMPNPTRWELDEASPEHPLALTDFSAHNLWVNSKALELAGVTKDTPDVEGGVIERDPANGELTGVFREFAAMGQVMKAVPLYTREEKRAAILAAMKMMNENGITSYTEAALGSGGDSYAGGLIGQECADIYKELLDEGKMTARVTVLSLFGEYGAISLADLERGMAAYEWPRHLDEKWLHFPGVKIFADGVPITKTSAMWEEYEGGGSGELAVPGASEDEQRAALSAMIRHVVSKGLQVAVHTTGDRAATVTLDALEAALAEFPGSRDTRPYLIHAEQVTPADVDRAGRLGVGFNMQPTIMSLIAESIQHFLGPERALRDWPFASALKAGIRLMASSDLPVTYPDWRTGLQAMVLREAPTGGYVNNPDERISLADAVRAYTINGAWQDHMDHLKGSIEVGKLADFCVLEGDLLGIDPHGIKDLKVALTIVGGDVVYDAGLV